MTALHWLVPGFQIFVVAKPSPLSKEGALLAEFRDGERVAVGREYTFPNPDGRRNGPVYFCMNVFNPFGPRDSVDVKMELFRRNAPAVAPPMFTPHVGARLPSVTVPTSGRRFAIVVGISKYQQAGKAGITELSFASADAEAFASALEQVGWRSDQLELLTDEKATLRNVKIALESTLSEAGKDDLIVLFWSGHGFHDPYDPEKVYFACYDTDPTLPATGYRMDHVRQALEERHARNVIVFADTCHAGKIATKSGGDKALAIRPYVEKLQRERSVPKGWIFMVSAETDRKAVEHRTWRKGAFTHCLVQALGGAADGYESTGPKDGVVTMGELRAYMESAMPRETRKVLGVAKHPLITTSSGDPNIWTLSLEQRRAKP